MAVINHNACILSLPLSISFFNVNPPSSSIEFSCVVASPAPPRRVECAETDDDRETEDPTLTRIDNLDAADGADTSSCRDPELAGAGLSM